MIGRKSFRFASTALVLILSGLAQPARAIDADEFGWWIYVGSVRSTLVTRYLGREGVAPELVAATQAARGCGLALLVDRLSTFRETPIGGEPLVFGPWTERQRVATALACVRRYVPAAFVTQALPPS